MVATAMTGALLSTASPISDNIIHTIQGESQILNEWVLDPCPQRYTADPKKIYAIVMGGITFKANGDKEPIFEGITSSTKENSIIDNIEQRIFKKLLFPVYWEQENVRRPNVAAKKNAMEICKKIFDKYDLEPDKILPSKENGIFLSYDLVNDSEQKSLIIETTNNLETAVVISDNISKQILYSEDINGLDFENAIRIFKETAN
jgi:hypothetical protein